MATKTSVSTRCATGISSSSPAAAAAEEEGEEVKILCEIVGATNLTPHPDLQTGAGAVASTLLLSDDRRASSLVKVRYLSATNTNAKGSAALDVHTTQPIVDSNNPIWAVDTGSLFIINTSLSDLTGRGHRVIFEIYDKDTLLGTTAKIGTAEVSGRRLADILLNKAEERIEFAVQNDIYGGSEWTGAEDSDDEDASALLGPDGDNSDSDHDQSRMKLALRFRLASRQDIKFIDCLKRGRVEDLDVEESDSSSGDDDESTRQMEKSRNMKKSRKIQSSNLNTDEDEALVGFKGMMSTIDFTLNASTTTEDGTKAVRVKPGPDPARPETVFLTEEDLIKTAYQPSYCWLEAGSGSLGRVYVEVLRCQGLPNMDAGGALGNLTDAFVSLLYEDALVQTPTIDDCLSPLFMPWVQRAFAFNMMHPLSPLYIAVFDYDAGPTEHDGIGRCVVNLENLKPGVSYTLRYGLYPSTVVTDREVQGTITIRIRIEAPDEKAMLLASRKAIPKIHVNVKKDKSLAVAKYTLYGSYDEEKYDLTLLRSYVNEIMEYKRRATYSVGDALRSLILWRGQVKVGHVKLPLHSLAAYVIATYVVERPHLVPSLMCFLAAWLMLANYTARVQHPSPWRRCRSVQDYVNILSQGKSLRSATRIHPQEGEKEARAVEESWKHRVDADYEAATKRWEMQQELLNIGDEKIHTEETGLQLDPLARLFPIQRRLCGVCNLLRRLNCVITWEDSYTSFWFTATCIGLGVCLFILPTMLLLHWLFRILVWGLGPWMKFLDLFLVSSVAYEDADERRRQQERTLRDIAKDFQAMSRDARVQGEDAFKLKALRMLRFGQYIAKVPERNITRHYDYPLAESFARPYTKKKVKGWEDRKVQPGQKLHGRMIPNRRPSRASADAERADAVLRALQGQPKIKHGNNDKKKESATQPKIDEDDLKSEEGIEIQLCEGITRPCRLRKRPKMKKIREGDQDYESDCSDESSVVSYMLVPAHISAFSGESGGTSVSSSLGMEKVDETDKEDNVVAMEGESEKVSDEAKVKNE
mmetsp:Transcript_37634/g.82419  ORF Transcript_37634/g.82419 Transcript_37634/m.82419 type:complete len:1040 (+) Transcript_37634:105-3224(+)|eukprot:CAMPEP_0178512954 /NCGR_PEP_ID=MMETSP0696-20121128/23198_1 /TAXON_ID=265572 /ORGANISM="Extubocellulus spinifer, Strain CCMP396" /LENGTH=1039 /DNA_ID=CAMNT_0020142883 /DNA_START=49 /DNA_END=3168 /DNA_ORIENTATION=-